MGVCVEVREIDYGLGFIVEYGGGRWIELNRGLRDYPVLRGEILNHELRHWSSGGWFENLWVDFSDGFRFGKQFRILKFYFKYPRSLWANSPLVYDQVSGKWGVIWFNVLCWLVLFVITLVLVVFLV